MFHRLYLSTMSAAALIALGAIVVTPVAAQVAAAPALLNYQGRLVTPDGNPVPDGAYSIRFSLWDAVSAGTEKWNQTIANVQVKNGTFAVLLNTNTAGLFNGNLWLETKIGTDTALSPRQQLVSVAYAMKANSVPDGSITGASIADNTITANKLTNDALGWLLTGNAATAGSFLGTTNNQPLAFRTNNIERQFINAAGNIGIGTNTPEGRLNVVGGPTWTSNGWTKSLALNTGAALELGQGGSGWKWGMGATNGSFYIFRTISENAFSPAIYNLYIDGTTGNVGIGTIVQSITDRLVIEGNTRVNGDTKVTGQVTANVVAVLGGSDVAEPYNVAPAGEVKPLAGMLVCIDEDKVGQMRVASRAYDSTVAGIISGANGINPGITLRQKGTVADGELPVASIGRVWCWCDADANGSIKAGDMLTTSDTPGHAMKVTDHTRANGTVIGKAMSSLKSGKGLVLVLVSLK